MTHFETDTQYLIDTTKKLVECDSPVGYYERIHELLRELVAEAGYELQIDNKATAYVLVEGKDTSKTVGVNAHLDTIGLIVRGFNSDGTLRVRQLGGINYHSIEGETCHVVCRDGAVVDGQVICNHHSVHVFEDARTMERNEDNMSISLIADVSSAEEARALGVSEGAVVAIDPHFEMYDNGYMARNPSITPCSHSQCTRRLVTAAHSCLLRWMSTYRWTLPSLVPTTIQTSTT